MYINITDFLYMSKGCLVISVKHLLRRKKINYISISTDVFLR